MKRKVLVFVVLLVVLAGLGPAVPLFPNAPGLGPGPSVMATGASSSGLGPSVDISYQVQNKTFQTIDHYVFFKEEYVEKDYFYYPNDYQLLLTNDTNAWNIQWIGVNVSELEYELYFSFPSPYTALTTLYLTGRIRAYDVETTSYFGLDTVEVLISVGDSSSTDYSILASTDVDTTEWNVTSINLDSDNVNDETVHGNIYVRAVDSDSEADYIYVEFDYFAFTYDTITETRRSNYSVQGGTLAYTISWDTWDYNVNTTLSPPSDWTFKDVNPDCEQTSDEFACLVPENYESIYTCDVEATANWEESWIEGFEGDYTNTWGDYGLTSHALEYVTVLDGTASVKLSGDSGDWLYSEDLSDFGECWLVYSVYVESGSVRVYVWDSNAWQYDEITTTGEWVTNVKHIADLKKVYSPSPHYTSILLYMLSASTVAYFDGLTLYDSSVTTGSTITGQMNNVHPNGYVGTSFFTFEYNCTSWLTTNTSQITDADGSWSIDASGWSVTASSQTFSTWNPYDFADYTQDTITYPWTSGPETTMHFSYYMADGTAMLFHTFKTYVDEERLPAEKPWYTTTSYTVNLTITDVWNDTVYQDTTQDVAEFVDVVTTSYWFIFTNQRDYSVNVTIEHNSHNVTMGDPIGPGEGFSRIFYTGDYTIYCWRSETGELEEGFPKDGTVSDRWEVYTEKSTGTPSGPGGLTLIDLTFLVLKSAGVAMFIFAIGFLFVWKVIWPRIKGED